MPKHILEINQDVKCKQCGKPGACKAGNSDEYTICLECVNKNMGALNMKIGPRTRAKAVELVGNLLEAYQHSIEETYCDVNGRFDISVGVRFEPAGQHGTKVTAKIRYVEKEVKESKSEVIDEEQMPIEF